MSVTLLALFWAGIVSRTWCGCGHTRGCRSSTHLNSLFFIFLEHFNRVLNGGNTTGEIGGNGNYYQIEGIKQGNDES
jgi:hypothetical protein